MIYNFLPRFQVRPRPVSYSLIAKAKKAYDEGKQLIQSTEADIKTEEKRAAALRSQLAKCKEERGTLSAKLSAEAKKLEIARAELNRKVAQGVEEDKRYRDKS